jgi:hypothetical protein
LKFIFKIIEIYGAMMESPVSSYPGAEKYLTQKYFTQIDVLLELIQINVRQK